MKKNFIILGVVVVVVLLLIFGPVLLGLGKSDNKPTTNTNGALRVWSYTDEQKSGAMGKMVSAAAKALPKTTIKEWRTEKDPDTYNNAVLLALTGATPPDVLALPLSDLPRWQGQLLPHPNGAADATAAQQVYTRAAAGAAVRTGTDAKGLSTDQLVALPVALDPLVLLYHKSAFAGYVGGYEPLGTWEQVLQQADELRAMGKTPWDMGAEHPWAIHLLLALTLQHGASLVQADGSVNQSREAAAAVDAAYADWQKLNGTTNIAKAGVPRALQPAQPIAATDESADAIARFARGDTAMLVATASGKNMVLAVLEAAKKAERDASKRNAMPDADDIAVAPLPQQREGERVTVTDGTVYAVAAASTQPGAAWAWLDQLGSDTAALADYAKEKGLATPVAVLNANEAKKHADLAAVYQAANGAEPLYLPGSAAGYSADVAALLAKKPSRISTQFVQLLTCRITAETGQARPSFCR